MDRPDEQLNALTRRRRPRILLLALGVAALAGGLVVTLVNTGDDPSPRTATEATTTPRVALLDRPQNGADRALAEQGWVLTTALMPDSIRFARQDGDDEWLAGRTRDGRICLVEHTTGGERSACATADELAVRRGLVLSSAASDAPGRWVVGGLVTDAVSRVRIDAEEEHVVHNVFVGSSPRPALPELLVGGAWRSSEALTATSSALRFSVLDQPARAVDALPPAVVNGPARIRPGIGDPTSARFALSTSGDIAFWVAPGDSPGIICVVSNPDQTGCAGIQGIEEHGALVFPSSDNPGGSWWRRFAAVVPDGYTFATIGEYGIPVLNNVVVFPTTPPNSAGQVLVLTGPAGRREVPF